MCTKLYTNSKDKSLHFLVQSACLSKFWKDTIHIKRRRKCEESFDSQEQQWWWKHYHSHRAHTCISLQCRWPIKGFHYYFFISKCEKRPLLQSFRSHINQWVKGDLKSEQSTYNLHYITVLTLWWQSSGYSVHPMMIAYIVFITS